MEMTKLSYSAVFHPEEDGGYSVDFPDLLGCVTEAIHSPKPSKPSGIKMEGRDFVSLIEYDEAAYLKRTDEQP